MQQSLILGCMAESPSAEFYDQWYSELAHAPLKDEITQRHLGLPPYLLSTSLLPWAGIADVIEALCLSRDDLLLDLACGRGGYGMEVAHRTGDRLVGIDYSHVAVGLATQQAAQLGREADFRVGDMAATGEHFGGAAHVRGKFTVVMPPGVLIEH